MKPTKQTYIGKNKVEEYNYRLEGFDWESVYINGHQVEETYDQAVERLERDDS